VIRLVLAAVLAVLLVPGVALAHRIVSVEVDCTGEHGKPQVHIRGTGWDVERNNPVRVTGPGLDVDFVVASEWTASIEVPTNGEYTIDWPNSGPNGPVEFTVRCTPTSTPTPSVTPTATTTPTATPIPTPRSSTSPISSVAPSPRPTLPPTDRATVEIRQGEPWLLVVAAIVTFLIVLVLLDPERRPRR
jgi:hypothetical protein